MNTDQHPGGEVLMAWIDHELPEAEMIATGRHVGACAECAGTVREFHGVSDRLRSWTIDPPSFSMPVLPGHRRIRPSVTMLAVAAIAMAGLIAGIFLLKDWVSSPGTEIRRSGPQDGTAATGMADSRVDVTLFIDWECPACLTEYPRFMQTMETLNRSHPGAIAWHIKDYPLDSNCNPNVRTAVHPTACDAAAVVRLARRKGRADEVIAALAAAQAERPTGLTRKELGEIVANVLGPVNIDAETAAAGSDIARDISDGAALNLRFVPAISVNGKLLDEIRTVQSEIESVLRNRSR